MSHSSKAKKPDLKNKAGNDEAPVSPPIPINPPPRQFSVLLDQGPSKK